MTDVIIKNALTDSIYLVQVLQNFWGRGVLPLKNHKAIGFSSNTNKIWSRLVYADGDAAATLLRPRRCNHTFVVLWYLFCKKKFN